MLTSSRPSSFGGEKVDMLAGKHVESTNNAMDNAMDNAMEN